MAAARFAHLAQRIKQSTFLNVTFANAENI